MWEDLKEHGSRHQRLKNEAFAAFSDRGAYPLAQSKPEIPWPELAEQLNEVIVRRVISHDIQASPRGRPRDKGLLAELFVLAARYAGQAPRPAFLADEARRALSSNISSQRLTSYLGFLNDSLLFRMVKPLEVARKKKTGADKITLCDHALRASYLQEKVPLTPEGLATDPALATAAGYIADSAVGYFLSTMPAIGVSWFPERGAEPEVDYVLVVGDKRVPLEVKYQTRIDPYRDTAGVRSFIERVHYNAVFGLLITRTEGVNLDDPRLICIPLSTLLLLR
jgi:predicted AAA+ superfamily ATPase